MVPTTTQLLSITQLGNDSGWLGITGRQETVETPQLLLLIPQRTFTLRGIVLQASAWIMRPLSITLPDKSNGLHVTAARLTVRALRPRSLLIAQGTFM